MRAGDIFPSIEYDWPWVTALAKNQSLSASKAGGKWLLFVSVDEIDEAWKLIADATEDGLLGPLSKAATMRPSPHATDPSTKVICVYTRDASDRRDVMRVREALRELGFGQRLPYKTNASTAADEYTVYGDRGIARYYE